MKSVSTLIVGGGWLGLKIANDLKRRGDQDFLIVEARETLAPLSRRSGLSLNYFPASEELVGCLQSESADWASSLQYEVMECRPQVFKDGQWRPFSGLGDSNFKSKNEFSRFGSTHEVKIRPSLHSLSCQWAQDLVDRSITQSEVTHLEVKDGLIKSVTINADKRVEVNRVVFTASPLKLNSLIATDGLSPKTRMALSRAQAWTAIGLDVFATEPPPEWDGTVFVFDHGSKDFEPVIGRDLGEYSRWFTLVETARADEHDYAGQCIRHIKRQLKRAWPDLYELPMEERIFVANEAFGEWRAKNGQNIEITEISNLYLAHSLLTGEPSPAGDLLMAGRLILPAHPHLNKLPETEASC